MSLTAKYYIYTTLASILMSTLSFTTKLGVYYGLFCSLFIIGGYQLGKRENK